jgi:hypothetical protein
LVRANGSDIVDHDGKAAALTEFFKGIIGTPGSSEQIDLVGLYEGRPRPSAKLTETFTEEEAKLALFSMDTNSAPGPDGFGPTFFRAAWTTTKSRIMDFLHAFHHGDAQLDRINRSHMVLLPKKPGAVDVDAFRPICLQNCTMKILSKLLTSRLQTEIPRLIDINQTGFVRGRSIADTFVYAIELVQVCHKRKKPAVILKLDFAKAFDTVNWDGLGRVTRARGFQELWISWMALILKTSKSAVLVNGCAGPWITCQRGLRQGDPISPYLFLIVAETLQRMISSCAQIRHPTEEDMPCAVLQYADDTLIVLQGDNHSVSALKSILDEFAALSGLQINFPKSTLVPIHMDEQLVSQCVQTIRYKREGFP